MQYYRSKEGDTVDRIVWLYYGRQNDGIVEAVLSANEALPSMGQSFRKVCKSHCRKSLTTIKAPGACAYGIDRLETGL